MPELQAKSLGASHGIGKGREAWRDHRTSKIAKAIWHRRGQSGHRRRTRRRHPDPPRRGRSGRKIYSRTESRVYPLKRDDCCRLSSSTQRSPKVRDRPRFDSPPTARITWTGCFLMPTYCFQQLIDLRPGFSGSGSLETLCCAPRIMQPRKQGSTWARMFKDAASPSFY
jgi:hypothetical protein